MAIKRTGEIGGTYVVGDANMYGLGDFIVVKAVNESAAEIAKCISDVAAERVSQDQESHGSLGYFDWISAIQSELDRISMTDSTGPKRERVVRVAAAAIAMLEGMDKQIGDENW